MKLATPITSTLADRRRRGIDDALPQRRETGNRPLGGVFAGPRGNEVIRLAFQPQETEDRGQRRQTDPAFAQPAGVQPGFVELQPSRQQIGDSLMQAGNEQASDDGVIHTVRFVIWRCSEEPGGQTASR